MPFLFRHRGRWLFSRTAAILMVMRILYVAMKHDYGDRRRGESFEHHNFYETLVRLPGHAITYFPFDEVSLSKGNREMNRALLQAVDKVKPHLVFCVLFTDEIAPQTLRAIGREGAVTFNWFTDDHWRFVNFSRHWAPLFGWVATTDAEAVPRYRRMGYTNVIKTQWGCNHFTYRPPALAGHGVNDYAYDVSFVGQPHSDRRRVIERLRQAGISVQAWGHGWPAGRLGQPEMINVFAQTKINLNLAKSSGGVTPKEIGKVFLNRRIDGSHRIHPPAAWLSNLRSLAAKGRDQIKGRNFEIPGSGGFLLTSLTDDLPEYYVPGREVAAYTDFDDLADKVRYYLAHDQEREAIRRAGYERTLREHTYVHRFSAIFSTMFPHGLPESRAQATHGAGEN